MVRKCILNIVDIVGQKYRRVEPNRISCFMVHKENCGS